jgi:aminopeptidase N
MEFPGLIMMGRSLYSTPPAGNRSFPEMVVAHEVAHQWWYGLVVNDQNIDAFIDEGLAEWAGVDLYFSERYGPAEGRAQMEHHVERWFVPVLLERGDLIADFPTDDFSSRAEYGAAVYAKAALGFAALKDEIGEEAFFSALRGVVEERRFQTISPGELQAAFEVECSCDVSALWEEWFEQMRAAERYGPGATPQPSGS